MKAGPPSTVERLFENLESIKKSTTMSKEEEILLDQIREWIEDIVNADQNFANPEFLTFDDDEVATKWMALQGVSERKSLEAEESKKSHGNPSSIGEKKIHDFSILSMNGSIPDVCDELKPLNEDLKNYLSENALEWERFDIFHVHDTWGMVGIRALATHLVLHWSPTILFDAGSGAVEGDEDFSMYILVSRFVTAMEEGYTAMGNSYHNFIHAADVLQSCCHYLTQGQLGAYFTSSELSGLVVAALIHDFNHPGRTNQFFIANNHEMALIYNDQSVLENYHIAEAFRVMRDRNCYFIHPSHKREYRAHRVLIVDLVLATDLTTHFSFINTCNQRVASGLDFEHKAEDRVLGMKLYIKCADLAHPSKPTRIHKLWCANILQEFFEQGDEEKSRSVDVSPFMDRCNPTLCQSQFGFINVLVRPIAALLSQFLDQQILMEYITKHELMWKSAKDDDPEYAAMVQKVPSSGRKRFSFGMETGSVGPLHLRLMSEKYIGGTGTSGCTDGMERSMREKGNRSRAMTELEPPGVFGLVSSVCVLLHFVFLVHALIPSASILICIICQIHTGRDRSSSTSTKLLSRLVQGLRRGSSSDSMKEARDKETETMRGIRLQPSHRRSISQSQAELPHDVNTKALKATNSFVLPKTSLSPTGNSSSLDMDIDATEVSEYGSKGTRVASAKILLKPPEKRPLSGTYLKTGASSDSSIGSAIMTPGPRRSSDISIELTDAGAATANSGNCSPTTSPGGILKGTGRRLSNRSLI
jgi:hypothetical protein